MLAVLSPAKKLDGQTPPTLAGSAPPALSVLHQHTQDLIPTINKLSRPDLQRLMKISPKLADLAFERHARLDGKLDTADSKPAVFAFKGDTYVGLEAESLDPGALDYAQDHLRILSGLYGLLRPLDLIQPYRLEMGTKLATTRGEDLYDFWGDHITEALKAAVAKAGGPLVNLASKEYFKTVKPERLGAEIVTPIFKDGRGGSYRVLGLFAKRARGMMARYIVDNRITETEDLKSFDAAGYRFASQLSSPRDLVFLRDLDEPSRP